MRRTILAVCLAISLGGCMIGPSVIKSDTLAYGDVIEDTTNKLLVLNVLRARDKAPLHFADIPIMRESLQQSFSFTWLDFFGTSRAPSSTRDSLALGTSVQKSPSFDLNHLHSKDFITGISSPIDPKVVKYWLDRGLDRRLALLLFFSAVEITETRSEKGPANTIRITNSPRDAVDVIRNRKQGFAGEEALLCDRQSDFERYLKLLNRVKTFFAHNYRERRLLARDVKPGYADDSRNLQAFAALDQTKVQLVYDRERDSYSVYALSSEQKIAFCFYGEADEGAAATSTPELGVIESGREAATDRRTCYQSVVDVSREEVAPRAISPSPIFFTGAANVKEPSRYCEIYNRFSGITPKPAVKPGGYPRMELRLYIRSVGEIFQFLGDLLHYQDEVRHYVDSNPQLGLKLNSPVTFGYCGDTPEPGCDDVFLRVDADPCNARFFITYREKQYHVGNFDPPRDSNRGGLGCRPDTSQRRDHTLEVLGVLHQLIGLNKSASDIRSTPSVNVLP
jgi:hypothetical protein